MGAILVDRRDVYKTRIKLMGKDIPLHGAVGFELFNNSDLGMTEFAQKITRLKQAQYNRNGVRKARCSVAKPSPSDALLSVARTQPLAQG